MKKIIILIFTLLIHNIINAQKNIVILNKNKEPVQFAEIHINNDTYFSNEKGKFIFNYYNTIDSIEITKFGYNSIKFSLNNVKDTIYLSKINQIELPEIILTYTKKNKNIRLGSLKSYRFNGRFNLLPKEQIISYFETTNKSILNKKINSIEFKLLKINSSIEKLIKKKKKHKVVPKKIKSHYQALLKFSFIKISENKEIKLYSKIIIVKTSSRDVIKIDLNNENLIIENKFKLLIEFVGYINNNYKIIERHNNVSIALNDDLFKYFKQTTYLINKNKKKLNLNKLFNKHKKRMVGVAYRFEIE